MRRASALLLRPHRLSALNRYSPVPKDAGFPISAAGLDLAQEESRYKTRSNRSRQLRLSLSTLVDHCLKCSGLLLETSHDSNCPE